MAYHARRNRRLTDAFAWLPVREDKFRLSSRAAVAACLVATGLLAGLPAQAAGKKAASAKAAPAKAQAKAAGPARSVRAKAGTAAASGAAVQRVSAVQPEPEVRLLQVITQVERGQLDEAIKLAARLTEDVPNFKLAQLVYADLLRYRAGRFQGAGAIAQSTHSGPGGAVLVKHQLAPAVLSDSELQEQLQGLQLELKRRVLATGSPPAAGMVPADVLQLGASVRHVIAIDESKSRLYLFANEAGSLRLSASYYVSVGKMGLGKQQEGDLRTPQGLYFVGRHIPGPRLPAFYGKGALTVNYPNDWDRAMGRAGSGIWLHGAPPDQFARLPHASDGCVVLANPDLLALTRTVDRQTPVLIRESLHWVAPQDRAQQAAAHSFQAVLDEWRKTRQTADARKLASLYAAGSTGAEGLSERVAAYFDGAGASLDDVSIYAWKEARGEVRIVNFRLGSRAFSQPLGLRQYWQKTASGWKILSEDTL